MQNDQDLKSSPNFGNALLDDVLIEEGNKLIMLFMGGIITSSSTTANGVKTIHSICYQEKYYRFFDMDAKYHSSWDWLMPVIEKISKIVCNETDEDLDTFYPRTFGMLNFDTRRPMFRFNRYCLFEADTLIEAAFLAVVDFIKLENANTPKV